MKKITISYTQAKKAATRGGACGFPKRKIEVLSDDESREQFSATLACNGNYWSLGGRVLQVEVKNHNGRSLREADMYEALNLACKALENAMYGELRAQSAYEDDRMRHVMGEHPEEPQLADYYQELVGVERVG